MNVNVSISLVTASYRGRDAAVRDFETVWGSRSDGDFHHTAIALLSRDSGDTLCVERSHSTAKHFVWGGALLGGALFVLAPAPGVELLASVGLNGAGALIYHFRRNADATRLIKSALVLDEGPCGLVVVAVNRRGADMTKLLAHAHGSSSVDMLWGDLEAELCRDFATSLPDTFLVVT